MKTFAIIALGIPLALFALFSIIGSFVMLEWWTPLSDHHARAVLVLMIVAAWVTYVTVLIRD